MKISVIIPTNRAGGVYYNLTSLSNQTFPKDDFEVIIIDDVRPSQEEEINKIGQSHGLNLKWMRSKPSHWRTNAPIGCARNTGLIEAEGELCVFIDDYSMVHDKFLDTHWFVYNKLEKFTLIGPVRAVNYEEHPRSVEDLTVIREDSRIKGLDDSIPRADWWSWVEHRKTMCNCSPGWFFTCNASAPLDKLIEVNGFWEIADLTREEDVMMGLALDRVGQKFCFIDSKEATLSHLCHDYPWMSQPKRYKNVSYDDLGWGTKGIDHIKNPQEIKELIEQGKISTYEVLGMVGKGRCGLNTKEDEIQLVTKDVFNTTHPGSWGLIEHFRKTPDLMFNEEIGFNLAEERKKRGR